MKCNTQFLSHASHTSRAQQPHLDSGMCGTFPWSRGVLLILLKAHWRCLGWREGAEVSLVRPQVGEGWERKRKTGEGWPLLTCWRCSWRWSSPREPGQDPYPSHPGGRSAGGCGPGAATAGSSSCLRDDRHRIFTEPWNPLGPCPSVTPWGQAGEVSPSPP